MLENTKRSLLQDNYVKPIKFQFWTCVCCWNDQLVDISQKLAVFHTQLLQVIHTVFKPHGSFFLPPDSTFTFPKLFQAIEAVQKWDKLGAWVGVPSCKRVSRETMVNCLITTTTTTSWERLSGVLYYLEEHAALDKATKYFERQLGMCVEGKCCSELLTFRTCIVSFVSKCFTNWHQIQVGCEYHKMFVKFKL